MERDTIQRKYKNIIQASRSEKMPVIDVTNEVMQQIAGAEARRRPVMRTWMRGATAWGTALGLILLLSVSAYAASEYIQLRNSEGDVKVEHVAATENGSGPYDPYAAKARNAAQPGDLVAYYVKTSDPAYDGLLFASKDKQIDSHAQFSQELTRMNAPRFPETALDYSFEYGEITPAAYEPGDSEYQKLYHELKDQASKTPAGQQLFMKKVPWSEASFVSALYAKGTAQINMTAQFMNGAKVTVLQKDNHTADIEDVAGTEVVYNSISIDLGQSTKIHHYLTWYNDDLDIYYYLNSSGDKVLTKQQFLQLAEDIMKQASPKP